MISVFIVDDDERVITALGRYFARAEDIAVAGAARDGREALSAIAALPDAARPQVVLCDVHMPVLGGIGVLRGLRELGRPPRFVAMTALDNDQAMLEILGGGGAGYILKSQPADTIIEAVRAVAHGGSVVSPAIMSRLVGYVPAGATLLEQLTAPDSGLSCSERRVAELLCQGLSNADIAREMRYSESSIKKYVSALMQRCGASSRLDLVVRLLNRP